MDLLDQTPITNTQLPIEPQTIPPEQLPQIAPKKSPLIPILLSLVIVILLGTVGYLGFQVYRLNKIVVVDNTPVPTPDLSAEASAKEDPTANWMTYTNKTYGYTLRYPSDKLTLCENYDNETNGPRFWNAGFDCVEGHDISYIIGVENSKNYDSYGYTPISTVAITVDKQPATKNIFTYAPEDGPLGSIKESEQIIIKIDQGVINIQRFGQETWKKEIFTQILSTFRFTDNSPTKSLVQDISPAPSPEINTLIPAGWIKHPFPTVGLILYAPKDWKSSIQAFPEYSSNLIRFWQGDSQDTSTVQLDISNNWNNKSIGNDIPFTLSDSTIVKKTDPPTMDQRKLDRYQTNYAFEKVGKVYYLTCVHNWIEENYRMCEQLLKSMVFTAPTTQ